MVVQGFPPLFSLWITGCLFTRCSIINDNQLMSLPYLKLSMTLHAARRGPRFLVSVCKVIHELCLKIPALTPHHSVLQNMDQALYYFGHSLVLFLLPSKSIFFWSQLILLVVGWMVLSPKKYVYPRSVSMVLFGKRVFGSIIKDLKMMSSWIIWSEVSVTQSCPSLFTSMDCSPQAPLSMEFSG